MSKHAKIFQSFLSVYKMANKVPHSSGVACYIMSLSDCLQSLLYIYSMFVCVYVIVQSINDELNASLATADELSREFSSLLSEATPVVQTTTAQVQITRLSRFAILFW